MVHAQKPDLVFRRNGRVHLNRRGRQSSRLLAAEVCASALTVGSNAGYTMFRGSEKDTDCPLHSPVSPSLPHPCVTACHHISTGLYLRTDSPFFSYLIHLKRTKSFVTSNGTRIRSWTVSRQGFGRKWSLE